MKGIRRAALLACAALLAFFGVVGIVRFYPSSAGAVVFHAFVLLSGSYVGFLALRRRSS